MEGQAAAVKTDASEAAVYVPPDLMLELRTWLECSNGDERDWLFPASLNGAPMDSANYLNRVLKPAAIPARSDYLIPRGGARTANPYARPT